MRIGVHLANGPVSDADYAALERLRPTAVSTMAQHHGADVYARLEGLCRPLYLVRCEPSVEAVRAAVAAVPPAVLRERRALFRVGNEPNNPREPSRLPAAEYVRRFMAVRAAVDAPLLVANLAFVDGWREYLHTLAMAIDASDGIALSLYRDDASDPGRWLDAYQRYGKRLYAVELNVDYEPHGDRRVGWWRWALDNLAGKTEAATVFILGGASNGAWPDDYILTPADVDGLAEIVRDYREGVRPTLNLVIVASNQDGNHPPRGVAAEFPQAADYSEAGGCTNIANAIATQARARGVNVKVITPPLESTDRTAWANQHPGRPQSEYDYLAVQMACRTADSWLKQQSGTGLVLHIHTDAAAGSHSAYCYTTRRPVSAVLGKQLAECCQHVLHTERVIGVDHTGADYIWDTAGGDWPIVYLEVCAHDVAADLRALYGALEPLADALVSAVLAWAGASSAPPATDRVAQLEAEVARLRAKLQQISALAGSAS